MCDWCSMGLHRCSSFMCDFERRCEGQCLGRTQYFNRLSTRYASWWSFGHLQFGGSEYVFHNASLKRQLVTCNGMLVPRQGHDLHLKLVNVFCVYCCSSRRKSFLSAFPWSDFIEASLFFIRKQYVEQTKCLEGMVVDVWVSCLGQILSAWNDSQVLSPHPRGHRLNRTFEFRIGRHTLTNVWMNATDLVQNSTYWLSKHVQYEAPIKLYATMSELSGSLWGTWNLNLWFWFVLNEQLSACKS